ncbi:MAG: VPLPA-CTERM sorting domain-containing protein [Pseudomonadota bacterium]
MIIRSLLAGAAFVGLVSPASAGSLIAGEDFEGTVTFGSQFTDTYGTGATSTSPAGDSPDVIGVVSDATTAPGQNSINQAGASNATNYFFVEDADGLFEVFFDSLQDIDTSGFTSLSLDFDFATGGDFEDPDLFSVSVNGNIVSVAPGNALQFQADGTFREGSPFPDGITGGFVSVSDLLGSPLDLSAFAGEVISISFGFQTNSDGEDIALDNITLTGSAVPIPGALPLMAAGLAGLGMMRRRAR